MKADVSKLQVLVLIAQMGGLEHLSNSVIEAQADDGLQRKWSVSLMICLFR